MLDVPALDRLGSLILSEVAEEAPTPALERLGREILSPAALAVEVPAEALAGRVKGPPDATRSTAETLELPTEVWEGSRILSPA